MTQQSQLQHESRRTTRSATRQWIFSLVVVGIALGSFFVGRQYEAQRLLDAGRGIETPLDQAILINTDDRAGRIEDFSLFWKAWDVLKNKYVDREALNAEEMLYGAIGGLTRATGDPYTTFFTPEEKKRFSEDLQGSFGGIGIEIGMRKNVLTVIAPLDGTPAARAGLRAGDMILKINGTVTADMAVDDAVGMIRGEKGSTVTLTIFHEGDDESRDVEIMRDTIIVKSVTASADGDLAVIKISRFGEETTEEFAAALEQHVTPSTKGLIIDLRNDPGGYLMSAVDVAGYLLPRSTVVVLEEDANGKRSALTTDRSTLRPIDAPWVRSRSARDIAGILSTMPTVVVINAGSASASEILAGALQDKRPQNVRLVGEKSFGKGSVQEEVSLPGGTGLKVTIAKWLTPNGRQVNEQGIMPDVVIEETKEDREAQRDVQLDKAKELLRTGF